ncbi:MULTISPECIES: response regulator transcription factor [Actinomadura]|uniref:Response regulator n=1 Tax=Actinomadura litoris TaxID=2678616 RepID=A0A7K1L3M8_9ACTN|nr:MULTISPECIES: response regulator transcription factor [Actinomadura]MBT2213532.1 response regulator transcription factor [Actinomadura sp. NEAU-AAG7]MUN38913.1 response regulator [Actinomadura litoris]
MAEQDAEQPPRRVLVVEDEDGIRVLLESTLRLAGYEVDSCDTGQGALLAVERFHPDLILLDVMLPDLDGLAVTGGLRAVGVDTPILFLTALGDVQDRIAGLAAGADDYVTKPFSLEEVLLRVQAILRRSCAADVGDTAGEDVLRYADLVLDAGAHEVHRAGEYVPLSPTEFSLLAYLMANPRRVLSKNQILDHVWRYDFNGDGRIVETYVKYLRRKIDRFDPPLIHTVRGVGYCLRLPREHTESAGP